MTTRCEFIKHTKLKTTVNRKRQSQNYLGMKKVSFHSINKAHISVVISVVLKSIEGNIFYW
jgi:hypothetical protein